MKLPAFPDFPNPETQPKAQINGFLMVSLFVAGALVIGVVISAVSLSVESPEIRVQRLEKTVREFNSEARAAMVRGNRDLAERKNEAAGIWLERLNQAREDLRAKKDAEASP